MTSKFVTPYAFIKRSGWLDIPEFFKEVRSINKGQQHKYVIYIEQLFADDWWMTLTFNTTKDIDTYRKFAKTLNCNSTLPPISKDLRKAKFSGTSRHRMTAQGLGDLINGLSTVAQEVKESVKTSSDEIKVAAREFTDEASAFIKNANQSLNINEQRAEQFYTASMNITSKIDKITDSAQDLLTKFNEITSLLVNKASSFSLSSCAPTIINFVCKFLALAYLLSQPQNQNLKNICALLVLIVPLNWSGLHSFANDLLRAIQGLAQKFVTHEGSDSNLILGFFELIKNIMSGLVTTVNDETFKKMNLSSNRLRVISDTIRSTSTIVDFIGTLINKILHVIGDKYLKKWGCLPWFAKDRTIEPLIDEYEKIKLEHIDEKCQIQKAAARRVIQLHDALVTVEAKIHKKFSLNGSNAKIAPYIRLMIKNLSEMVAKIPDHFRSGKNPRRVKPFWVYIYGDPRIGKSALFQPYIVNALAKSLQLIPAYEDYTNYTYFRNCGDEYWEGYYGHDVLWYNDLFQNHADEPAMHKAVMELTNVIDDNLFPLNMAFERKHGVYFDSELVVSNAQDDIINAGFIKHKCWSGGNHLFARRNVVLEFTLNPRYSAPNGVGYDPQIVEQEIRSNPNNCFGKVHKLFPSDMYIINVRNPINGNMIHTFDFDHTIKFLQETAVDFKKRQNVFKDKLYDEFAELWQTNGEEDDGDQAYVNYLERVANRVDCSVYLKNDAYINFLRQGEPYLRMHRFVLDSRKLPFKITRDYCGCDRGYLLSDLFQYNHFDTVNAFRTALVGILKEDLQHLCQAELDLMDECPQLFEYVKSPTYVQDPNSKYATHDTYVSPVQTQAVEEVYYDASSLEENIADAYIEPISEQIRKVFPDLAGNGWYEEIKNFSTGEAATPYYKKGKRSARMGQHLQFSKYFTGTNLTTGQKCRIILSVEAIGYRLFDNMSVKATKSFCQMARDAVKEMWQATKNLIMNNDTLQAFLIGSTIGSVYLGFVTLFLWTVKKVAKIDYNTFSLPDLIKHKEQLEKALAMRQVITQTAEGNAKPPNKQVKRVLRKGVTQGYDSQNLALERILTSQMCKFGAHVVHEGQIMDKRMYGSGLCVAGDIFLLPDHFVVRWHQLKKLYDSKGDKFVINLYWSEKLVVELDWESLSFYKLPYEHTDDLSFVRIKNLVQMRNLSKFFCKVDDSPSLFECYLYGRRAAGFTIGSTGVQRTELASQIYTHPERVDTIYGEVLSGREIQIPLCYRYYDTRTINGDCGVLLLNSDSKMNCRKILGMHTAGELYSAVSSIIYQEDVLEAIEHFNKISRVIQIEDVVDPVEACQAQELEDLGLKVIGQLPPINEPGYPVKNKPKICLPRKTKISRSVVYDIMEEDFGKSLVEPARLRPFKNTDGEVISPLHVGLKKLVRVAPMVSSSLTNRITRHMLRSIKSWPSPYVGQPRLLTDDEVINGFGIIKPIEMKTSPGYPYVQLDNTNGKIPFFRKNGEKWEMGDLLRQKYLQRENDARSGIVTPTFFIATLKDETRPKEKVAIGKTRLFQISPVDFNMLLRKYFGFFVAHCHSTSLIGEMAVGINANSYEWGLLLKKMKEVGNKFINGDGEVFDASTGQSYSMANVEVINEFYDDGPINALVRRVLYATFLNARNIIGNLVFLVYQGNMSGIWITTIFNNMTGMFAVRYTYLRLGYDLELYHRLIRNTHYGDDDLICKSDVCAEFTFQQHAETMRLMGIKYTTALKGEIILDYFDETQINFLKRSFFRKDNLILPRLPLEVILEIPRWSESDPTKMEDQLNRYNSALLEISNYGEEEFNKLNVTFEKYCFLSQNFGYQINPAALFSYERCFEIKFPNIVGEHSYDQPDLACFKSKTQVLRVGGGSGSEKLDTIDEPHCCNFVSYESTANFETQTAEGSAKPPVKNIVRIVKTKLVTQGDEAAEAAEDFQCEMLLMEKVKEIAPYLQTIYECTTHQLSQTNVRRRIRKICNASQLLYMAYRNCMKAFQETEMTTQSDEMGDTITHERKKDPAQEPGTSALDAGPFLDGSDVVEQKSAMFINDNVPHQPTFMTRTVRKDWNNIRDINLQQFYERPYVVEEFAWAAGNDMKLLKTYNFPSVLYNITALKNKLDNIKYARPDIEVEIMVNGTAFHYGTLTMCVVPYPKYVSNAYLQSHSVTTWPQWYSITAGADQNLKFVIPFRSMSHTQSTLATQTEDWAALKIYVTCPLRSVSTATPPSVGVTVMARLLRPQFNGMYAQGEEISLSSQAMTTMSKPMGPISVALDGVSNVINNVKPLVHATGWSNPVNAAATMPMQVRFPLFCKVDDLPSSQILGPSQTSYLDHDMSNVNAQLDEMNFSNFINHPSLTTRAEWISTQAAATVLIDRSIDNGFFTNTQGSSASVAYFTPLGYLLNAHKYWRGSVRVCIRVVASQFHAGRIRAVFVPQGSTTTITLQNSVNFKNVTIDVNGTTDTVLELPFEFVKPWVVTEIPATLKIIVVNPLTGGSTDTPQGVFVQLYAWGADDFQLSYPQKPEWKPDMRFITAPTMATQGEEVTPCLLSATSADCLKAVKPIWLGDVNRKQKMGNNAMSFVYNSVKQSCNMLTPLSRYTTKTTDKLSTVAFNPLYGINDIKADNDIWCCLLIYYRSIYMFGRGGYRLVCLTDEELQVMCSLSDTSMSSDIAGAITAGSTAIWSGTPAALADLGTLTYPFAFFRSSSLSPPDVTVPYFSSAVCSLLGNGRYVSNSAIPTIDVTPGTANEMPCTCSITVSNQETEKTFIVFCSGADDLMFGCRRGIPQMTKTAAARSTRDTHEVSTKPNDPMLIVVKTSKDELVFDLKNLKFISYPDDKQLTRIIDLTTSPINWDGLPEKTKNVILRKVGPGVSYDLTRVRRALFDLPSDLDESD